MAHRADDARWQQPRFRPAMFDRPASRSSPISARNMAGRRREMHGNRLSARQRISPCHRRGASAPFTSAYYGAEEEMGDERRMKPNRPGGASGRLLTAAYASAPMTSPRSPIKKIRRRSGSRRHRACLSYYGVPCSSRLSSRASARRQRRIMILKLRLASPRLKSLLASPFREHNHRQAMPLRADIKIAYDSQTLQGAWPRSSGDQSAIILTPRYRLAHTPKFIACVGVMPLHRPISHDNTFARPAWSCR